MAAMRLIASGRDADVFDLGDGRVLRRHKDGRPATKQADLLRYVAAHGYPVPALHDASGPDLILERLDGPEMQRAIRPWNVRRMAGVLAELHRRLHEIPPLPGLDAPFGDPRALLHLDLHPRNVVLTAAGPKVIDWANAANGPPDADVALLYVIGKTTAIRPRYLAPFAASFLDAFVRAAGGPQLQAVLPAVAEWRKRDRNVTAAERAAIDRLLGRVTLGR
jgi:aminoglycoside/choline kinase family phosphotransferase